MGRDGADPELVSVINKRMDLLGALTEPRSKRSLVDELDLSRSTVNRAVRQLETLGLVTRDGEYRLTVAGQLVVSVFEEFAADLGDVVRAEGLLTSLPPDAPIDVAMVRDAEIHRPTEPGPAGPVAKALETLESAVRIRLLIPRISRSHTLEVLEDRIVDGEVPATLVLSSRLVEHFREQDADWLGRFDAADNCDLFVAETLPYTLGVVRQEEDVHAGLLAYDSDGTVEGFIRNDTLRAYAWAEQVFLEYRDDAVPLAAFERDDRTPGADAATRTNPGQDAPTNRGDARSERDDAQPEPERSDTQPEPERDDARRTPGDDAEPEPERDDARKTPGDDAEPESERDDARKTPGDER